MRHCCELSPSSHRASVWIELFASLSQSLVLTFASIFALPTHRLDGLIDRSWAIVGSGAENNRFQSERARSMPHKSKIDLCLLPCDIDPTSLTAKIAGVDDGDVEKGRKELTFL